MEFTDEHKQKLAAAIKASWTPERREAMRQKRLGANNPFFGKKHTEEFKNANRSRCGELSPRFGRKTPEERRIRLSAIKKGRAVLLYRHGISDEEYAAKTAQGLRWCAGHKDFYAATGNGKQPYCNDCDRKRTLQRKFGVPLGWYDDKLSEQNGGCALCGTQKSGGRRKYLCADHDHRTGGLRGLLCGQCNSAIERLDNVPNWAQKAQDYLKQYEITP